MGVPFRKKGASPSAAPRRGGGTLVLSFDDRVLYEADVSSLASRSMVVGRSKTCDWCTAGIDGTLSSRHAELFRRRGSVWIRDLGSRNGMFFGGERVAEHRFEVGDSVLLGSCRVTLEKSRADETGSGSALHRLEQLSGEGAGRTLELAGDEIVFGSDPGSDVFLADTLVSRRHAKLAVKKDGSCWISDLGSRNGTTVNGTALARDKERMLRDGDVVSVSDVEFRFVDKSAVHVNAALGLKLLVVAATVAAGVVVYSLWGTFRPDAGRLLSRAQAAAAAWSPDSVPEDFAVAFALLDQAAVARKADARISDWNELKFRMESWTNTIRCWKAIRGDLRDGKWVWAQEKFHDLSSWTWNAGSASAAHREADAALELVNAFLEARVNIRVRTWDAGRETAAFSDGEHRLSTALKAALKAAEAAAGEGGWLAPLAGEAQELSQELRSTLDCLSAIPKSLDPLFGAVSYPPRAAADALAKLDGLLEADRRHAAEREAEILSEDFPFRANPEFPYHAPVVAARIGEVRVAVEALAKAERTLADNVDRIASGEWNSVRRDLGLPERDVTDRNAAFLSYRRSLEEANAELCGPVLGEFESRLGSLEKAGFGKFVSSRPPVFGALSDPAALEGALAFVGADTPFPSPDWPAPVCSYDRFAGVRELGDFLSDLASRPPTEAASGYDDAWATPDRKWRSVLADARTALSRVRSFRAFAEGNPSPFVRFVLEARPKKGNRCADAVRAAARVASDVEDWCAEELSSACAAAGTERAAVFGEAAALLLSPDSVLSRKAAEDRAKRLSERYSALVGALKKMDAERGRDIRDEDEICRRIVDTGLPFDGRPYKGAWRRLSEQGGKESSP